MDVEVKPVNDVVEDRPIPWNWEMYTEPENVVPPPKPKRKKIVKPVKGKIGTVAVCSAVGVAALSLFVIAYQIGWGLNPITLMHF